MGLDVTFTWAGIWNQFFKRAHLFVTHYVNYDRGQMGTFQGWLEFNNLTLVFTELLEMFGSWEPADVWRFRKGATVETTNKQKCHDLGWQKTCSNG